jgi:two-component system sensor histidine kinase/response regulator
MLERLFVAIGTIKSGMRESLEHTWGRIAAVDRRRAEEALLETEEELRKVNERLELAVRSSNVALWERDMTGGLEGDGRAEWLNFWEQWGSGNPDEHLTSAAVMSIVHPDDRDRLARLIEAYLSGETNEFKSEHRAIHRDGSYHWMLTRGLVFRDSKGNPLRFSGSTIDITDQKRAEEALRASEKRFQTFVDHASDAFFLQERDGTILDVNHRACESLGYTRDELVGRTPFNFDPDVTLAITEDSVRRLHAGETVAFVSRHRRKDGSVFPVEVRTRTFWEGDRFLMVSLARDITERRRAEAALRLSEQRYRSLAEASVAIIWTTTADGVVVSDQQSSWSNFTGKSLDQLTNWNWLETLHPDDRAHTVECWSDTIATRSLYRVEYRVRRHDGEYRTMLTRGVPIFGEDGEIREWFGTCVDITDLKRAEAALRESEERFRGPFENAAVGIAHVDAQGNILRVNQKLYDIVGYPNAELIGKTIPEVTHPDDLAANLALFSPLMQGELPSFAMEKRFFRKDGSIVWTYLTVSLQRDTAGQPAYCIAIVQDITDRKELEGELRQAKESAEAANRSKDEFLASVSHEIRTPMNAILGMTELALDTPLAEDQRQFLKTVKSAADNLLGILNDLLDFSKIEAGKLELDPGDFSLRAALGDTLRTLAMRAHKKGLELVSHVRPDVPDALIGDASRLRQVLLNLVGNAIKFTDDGEVVVRVEADDAPASDRQVNLRFDVIDTGIGIPPERHDSIFRAFEQEDTSTTRKYGGTGLGLTIATRLAALMGGTITVESRPGRGSIFTCTAKFGLQTDPPGPIVARPPVLLHDLPVLIVDDNGTNRRILEEWLRGWQMEPAAVGEGLAALDALWGAVSIGRPYALVLLDARMPDTDGLALAAKIRNRAELAATRIILLTSGDRPGDPALSRQLRIDANLLKPVQQDELLETIFRVMSRAPGEAPAAPWPAPTRQAASAPALTVAPLHILVAEDDEFSAEILEQLLIRRGHRVRLAKNGREALGLTENAGFDLLLLDVHMPELDGLQVVQEVRERERAIGGHLPVIALTARSRKEDRERCMAAGMDDFLSKPVRAVDLWAAIDRFVVARPRAEPPATVLLDARVLWDVCGGDVAVLDKIIRVFRARLPDHLAAAKDALRERNTLLLRDAAHKLCGMVAAFSTVAGRVASDLEDRAARGQLEEARPLVEQIQSMGEELMSLAAGLTIESLRRQADVAEGPDRTANP